MGCLLDPSSNVYILLISPQFEQHVTMFSCCKYRIIYNIGIYNYSLNTYSSMSIP